MELCLNICQRHLLRQRLGSARSIWQMMGLFKFATEKIGKLKIPITMNEATLNFVPHVFLATKKPTGSSLQSYKLG